MAELTYELFADRAETSRRLAEQADDPRIRIIHDRAAENYAELAKMSPPTASLRAVARSPAVLSRPRGARFEGT